MGSSLDFAHNPVAMTILICQGQQDLEDSGRQWVRFGIRVVGHQ